jgi:hypothetical protein
MADKPIIGSTEPRDQHGKFYAERSVMAAIKEFQYREGMSSFSEATRALILEAFSTPGVFGGYVIK